MRRPIQIIHVAPGSAASSFTRCYLHLGNGAHASVVENFIAADSTCGHRANDAIIVLVGNQAALSYLRMGADAADAVNVSSGIIVVSAKAKLNLFNMTHGGAVSRYQVFVTLAGEGAELSVNGLNLLKHTQHADATLVVDHAFPHCTSRNNFHAVVDDDGRSVFQRRIIVRPHARKTDAKLTTRALLLSDQSEADNKPEFEIFADDVSCAHGATSGALDENLLFYLRARGISERDSQALLIKAFLAEGIADGKLRDIATAQTEGWLEARR
ncbi:MULTISPECIES: SufD family Fe-S cluster assembly protein [unclassified Bradyrhizobium]|uniref:SufB/SufD family protein n=1 Tax=unclassified Bradyrhizobium TaxID=2631580 RepID=UPI000A7E9FA4|nr:MULTISPECIES: SufD family Fe-S cluster assembly protein [unclassified Bradyrhizobium]